MPRLPVNRWIVCTVLIGTALLHSSRAERLPVKVYTSADGLGSSFIDYLMRDSRGFLWFCTRDGLNRFDGSRFVTYQIGERDAPPGIESISETSGGVYWVSTTQGMFRFRADAVALDQTGPGIHRPVLPAEHIGSGGGTVLEDRQGRLYLGAGGFYRINETNGKVTTSEVKLGGIEESAGFAVTNMFQAADDCLWLNTTMGIIRLLPDGRVVLHHVVEQLDRSSMSMLLDSEGRIWFSTGLNLVVLMPESFSALSGAGPLTRRELAGTLTTPARADQVIALPAKPGDLVHFSRGDFLAVHPTRKLYQTTDHHVWLTTERELLEYDGEVFHRYTVEQGLLPSMSRMTEDIAGNLWIAGQTGLVRLDRRSLRTYTEADGLNSVNLQAINEASDGSLYFANGEFYLSRLTGSGFHTERAGVPDSALSLWTSRYALLDHRGDWWVLTKDKLFRFAPGNLSKPAAVYSQAEGLKANQMFQIFEDRQGNIWVSQRPLDSADNRGLSVLRPGAKRFYTFSEAEGYPKGRAISSFAEDAAGRLWLGFYEGGLARYENGRFTFFGADTGVPKGLITDLQLDRAGRLWMASSNAGVSWLDDTAAPVLHFVNLSTVEGLSSNNVRTITEDLLGNIYLGTVRGVDRIAADNQNIKHFSVSDGLAGDFVVDSHCDRQGVVWFATTSGLSRLVPTIEDRAAPPAIWLGGLRVAGVAQPVFELGQTSIPRLELTYSQNTLQVDFFGLDFRSGQGLRYQYKLEEANQEWSVPSEQRTVTLANLQPGTYRFLVRAVNSNGEFSPQPATIDFRILSPIWLRWWFLALAITIVIGLLVIFYRYRLARLRDVNSALQAANRAAENLRAAREERLAELQRVRSRIATDLHDDIGASLTQIAILSEVAQQQNALGNGAVAQPLEMIYDVSSELVGTMSDIVWAINPSKDHLPDLTQRMRRFASDILSNKEIDFEFIAPSSEENLSLGANIRREVFLIFKETINNVVKHSGATVVGIEFKLTDGQLQLRITDNGGGFVVPSSGAVSGTNLYADQMGGNGLPSMKRRAADLGGEFIIDSKPGAGTTITLNLPMHAIGGEAEAIQLGSDGKAEAV